MVRGRGGMEEGEEEVVSSIPGGAGSPASYVIKILYKIIKTDSEILYPSQNRFSMHRIHISYFPIIQDMQKIAGSYKSLVQYSLT